jgi:uncharacterized phage protein gp47/JayE
MSDAQGALCHLTLQYIDWLALQLIPDTAEHEWLDRHGQIWLVNADGTTGRKLATLSQGTIEVIASINGTLVPQFSQLLSSEGILFETLEQFVTSSAGPVIINVRSLEPGANANMTAGDTMSFTTDFPGLEAPTTVVGITGGTDDETDDQLRSRVLQRIREPPMGGSANDYVQWALAVPGVTRAWCAPLEMGIGTVTVRFLMDDLRADDDGWPNADDIAAVEDYLNTMRPVAIKDFWVLAPIKQFVDVEIANLVPDTTEIRAAVEQSLLDMLFEFAAPGQTIFAAWKSFAVMSTANVQSFQLVNTADDVMPSPGHMAVLGDIVYD